jgi:cell shape-determining protein MreD
MVVQIILNSSTSLYLDLMGALIIILLLTNNYNFKSLIILTFLADLIGHWYLGTHLFAAICMTFLTGYVTNFFNISTLLKKNIILAVFYTLFLLIIALIDLGLHNIGMHWFNFVIEVGIFSPLILKSLNTLLINHNDDIIF